MPLCLIHGDVGSGKTLFLAYLATKVPPEIPIYSNFKLNVPNYKPLEPEQLMDLPENRAEVYLDEGYVAIDSRHSMANMNRFFSYVLFQSRKRGLNIYITAQEPRVLDIRFREMAKIVVFCAEVEEGFRYDIICRRFFMMGDISEYSYIMPMEIAKKYFSVYETKEVVENASMRSLKNEFVYADPQKMTALINQATKDVKNSITTLSKDAVETALIEKGYPTRISRFVYVKIKDAIARGETLDFKKRRDKKLREKENQDA